MKPTALALPSRSTIDGWKISVLALLAVAAFLRLYRLDLISITADEGIHGLLSMNLAIFKDFPQAGLPSVGIRNSAFFLYLLAIPYVVVRHPLAGAAFVALLNVAAIYLAVRLTAERFGRVAAAIAGLLMTFSPWGVLYSRNMWPPSCLAIFCLPLITLALRWLDEGGAGRLTALVFLAIFIPQVHFSGFCAPVWTVAVLIVGRKRLSAGPIVAGLTLGLLSWAPWLHWQHDVNEWVDLKQVLQVSRATNGAWATLVGATGNLLTLLGPENFDYWFAAGADQLPDYFPAQRPPLFLASAWVASALFVAAVVWSLWTPADRTLRLLVLWTFLPVVLLALVRPPLHPHYVLIAYPAPFVLIGAFLGRVCEGNRRRVAGAILLTLVLCGIHLLAIAGWYRFVRDDRPTGAGHYQLSYRQRRAAALSALEDSGRRMIHLSGAFSGLQPGYDFIYNYEQIRQGYSKFPPDDSTIYWMDEAPGEAFEPPAGWAVEKSWRVGPTRIVRLRWSDPSREPVAPSDAWGF